MDLTDIKKRKEIGDTLKKEFLAGFDIAVSTSRGNDLAYRDLEVIGQSMEDKIKEYNIDVLPSNINIALNKAKEILDPRSIKSKQLKSKWKFLLVCMLGVYLIASGFYDWISYGEDYSIFKKAFFWVWGEKKEFPIRIIPGIALVGIALYGFGNRETPAERTIKCQELVLASIEEWVKNGK